MQEAKSGGKTLGRDLMALSISSVGSTLNKIETKAVQQRVEKRHSLVQEKRQVNGSILPPEKQSNDEEFNLD